MKKKLKEMEEEALKLKEMQAQVEKEINMTDGTGDKEAVDSRSVYIGNVDYGATPEEVQNHFQSCGAIQRVTIICDKYTGHPKGFVLYLIFRFAYIEFAEESSISNALSLSESLFRGRLIKVMPKRTNIPAFAFNQGHSYRGSPRGGYARGNFRGGFSTGSRGFRGGYPRNHHGGPSYRGRGRSGFYSPY